MNKIKKILSFALVLVLVVSVMSFAACASEVTYKVTVKDALGNPFTTGVIVQFLKKGEQVAMQTCDENGVATKTISGGKYDVALKFTDESTEYYYDTDLSVSSSKNEVEVIVSYKVSGEPRSITASGGEYDAYYIGDGCTYVELVSGKRNYFLYQPKKQGNYEFSVLDNENVKIGYYGTPHFVQDNSAADVVDNKFTISVSDDMISTDEGGTSVYVIGVDVPDGDENNCIICINRLGDAIKTLEDEPWTIYEKTVELSPYTLPEGAEIKEFDLTASTDTYKLVFNEEDGFYHLDSKDGPLVLVRLAEDCQYIDCFQTILDRSGIVAYYFDEDGNFVDKVSFSDCLLEYIEYVDVNSGVYPLTEDLKHIIQERGEYVDWWNDESANYRFKDMNGNNLPGINNEIAWLFMCCYIE